MLISKMPDNNIFHIFYDIIKYYNPTLSEAFICEDNIDKNNACQKWRLFVMEKLYSNVKYIKTHIYNFSIKTSNAYIHWIFIKYKLDPTISNIVNKINSKLKGEYILLNQRDENNRYLYDKKTKLALEEYLNMVDFGLPFKYCNFNNMSVLEQYNICSKAAIFITAHGAGCTNLIFTPLNCPLIEINFRKHWYCDSFIKQIIIIYAI